MSFTRAAALELLRRSHQEGRLAHAYLIAGPEAAETRTLAAEVAGLVLGSPPTLSDADIHILEPESKLRQIGVEQTRAIERELRLRSLLGNRKIAILFDADRMTSSAANSFLKTLEEPPANSLLLLTSTAPETLPDTIRSRCIPITLSASTRHPVLTPRQRALLDALRENAKHERVSIVQAFGLLQVLSGLLRAGREEFAAENATALKADEAHYKQTTGRSHWLDDREDYFKALTESRYVQERFALVDTLLQWWGDVLRQQAGSVEIDLIDYAADTGRLAQRLTTAEALHRVTQFEELRANLNRTGVQEQLALEVAFLKAFT